MFHCTTPDSFLQDRLLDAFLWRMLALLLTEKKKLRYRVMKGTGMSSWHIWEITPKSLPPSPAPKAIGVASYANPTRVQKPSIPKLKPMDTQPEDENHPPLEVTAHKYRRFCLRRHSEEPELSYCKKSSCLKLVITKVLSLHWWLFCSLCVPKAPDPTGVRASSWFDPSIPADLTAKR